MAQTVRSRLATRDARLRLKLNQRHFQKVEKGVALCYRRGPKGAGTWSVRLALATGRYSLEFLGEADDYSAGDDHNVLTFAQAQRKALGRQDESRADDGSVNRKLTVAEAAENYLTWFREHRKGVVTAEGAVRTHILPTFGDRPVASLKSVELRAWLDKLATKPARLRTSRLATTANTRPAPWPTIRRGAR